MADGNSDIALPLPRNNPVTLIAAGRRAFREVPGLRKQLVVGFLLLYGISFVVGLLAVGGLYFFVLEPWTADLAEWSAGEGFWMGLVSGIARALIWIVEGILMAASVVLAFLISLSMMSVWFEALVARIIAHCRGTVEERPFDIRYWIGSIGRSLVDSLGLIAMSVLALLLVFIPVIGPVLVILIQSYLLGREVRDPYLVVRENLGEEAKELRRGLSFWTMRTGLLPFLFALIPVVGWLFLPMAMIYLVAGFAWQGEQARAGKS